MKAVLLLLTKPPNARKLYLSFCFMIFFRFFVFAFWSIETITADQKKDVRVW